MQVKQTMSIQASSHRLIPVILCGGSGSRLWPLSREQHPKPFIRLRDNFSLLQKAFSLGANLPDVQDVIIVTNQDLQFKIKEEIEQINQPQKGLTFIIEPVGRNTAAAIASAALHTAKFHGPDTCLIILAADHIIGDHEAFANLMTKAAVVASQDKLVTFGISPHFPHTGYGYIHVEGQTVRQFIEKPDVHRAQDFIASGQFLWNSGMYMFTPNAILNALHEHSSDILQAVTQCMEKSDYTISKTGTDLNLDPMSFAAVPHNSIDYAVVEKAKDIAVLACDIDWSDIGSWSAVERFVEADEHGNRIEGEVLLHEVSNCYIKGADRLIGAVGVKNLIIIDTPDALLVADKQSDQDVRHLYTQLKRQDHSAHKLHRTVHRPWGTFTVIEESEHCKIKRLEVNPGASLSLQMHHHRSEHWIVVNGIAWVLNNEKEFLVRVNESTYIKAGSKHRLENPGMFPLVLIEVQTGDYLGEDDIVRFEDRYGRV